MKSFLTTVPTTGETPATDCRAGSNPTIPINPCNPIGRGVDLKNRLLLVRVQSGVSIDIRSNLDMVSEVEVVEMLVCEASDTKSDFKNPCIIQEKFKI